MSILSFSNLSYSYDKKKNIFSNISAEMELGKIYAILGPSGCGKTTLLSLLGGLDSPTKGKILFNGEDITEKGFANHRRNHVSFIFQAYNLIDYMTPLENVKLTSKLPPEPVLEKMGEGFLHYVLNYGNLYKLPVFGTYFGYQNETGGDTYEIFKSEQEQNHCIAVHAGSGNSDRTDL